MHSPVPTVVCSPEQHFRDTQVVPVALPADNNAPFRRRYSKEQSGATLAVVTRFVVFYRRLVTSQIQYVLPLRLSSYPAQWCPLSLLGTFPGSIMRTAFTIFAADKGEG